MPRVTKRILSLAVPILLALLLRSAVTASADPTGVFDFRTMMDNHGAVMLLIDPDSGAILYANAAASTFYGYPPAALFGMTIADINMLSPEEIAAEMADAVAENRNYFVFRHRLADGSVRDVEVFSYPVEAGGRQVLYSVVHDITDKAALLRRERAAAIRTVSAGGAVIVALAGFSLLLSGSRRRIRRARDLLDRAAALRQTFVDADDSLISLRDENLEPVFVNRAFKAWHAGRTDRDPDPDADDAPRRAADRDVLGSGRTIVGEEVHGGRTYRATRFPVSLMDGKTGVGMHMRDITEEKERERLRETELSRLRIQSEVAVRDFPTRREQLDFVLRQALALTGSRYGYVFLYDEPTREFTLDAWTDGVMADCAVRDEPMRYRLESTGVWGEAVRLRAPLILNAFRAPSPLKKGYPEGHVELDRFMTVPVILDGTVVAVAGMANKEAPYDDNDVLQLSLLMTGAWRAVELRDARDRLTLERNRYRQTLESIGDGVVAIGRNGSIVSANEAACRLTGRKAGEMDGRPYRDVFRFRNETSGSELPDPIEAVSVSGGNTQTVECARLSGADGADRLVEAVASPILDAPGDPHGVVLVFRDIGEKRSRDKEIEYLSYHDALTGLYNRRFFETELRRLDTPRNLPLSIVMGDVNGLKSANDLWGHDTGDRLLQTVSGVLQRHCRADDIIARWGGDEFILLLPRTVRTEAEGIVRRIRDELEGIAVDGIPCSLSMGCAAKTDPAEGAAEILREAEMRMYRMKESDRPGLQRRIAEAALRRTSPPGFREGRDDRGTGAVGEAGTTPGG